jgi:hypothetical protein
MNLSKTLQKKEKCTKQSLKCMQIRIDFSYCHIDYNIDDWGEYEVKNSQNIFEIFIAFERQF